MISSKKTAALAAALLLTLSACGDNDTDGTLGGAFMQAARGAVAQAKGTKEAKAQPAVDPSAMAAEALRVNPGPLIMVTIENTKTTQVLAMMGENAGARTYMTKNEQAIVLRNGIVSATRGLGNDMSSADMANTSALVRSSRSGQAQKTLRFYSGDGLERPLVLDCTVAPGPNAGVMVESCEGRGLKVQNNYMVQGGRATVSRQWIGPGLGYVTIQELRP